MKPVRLEFSGLHSYRQKQEVDFAVLGAGGLFGIFGPTGCGKSTILDAMTLALFGNVERAKNGTRGVVNQRETSARVSFEFELGGSRYRIDRLYECDRSDQESARAKEARLRRWDSDGVEHVVASRPNDTTAAVIALLGLRPEEFSRAIILPQGKFDQFLKLTGGERAKMLGHIFNLERFGDDLAKRAANERARCEVSLSNIDHEEKGLGDCSAEVVEAAEAAREAACAEFTTVQALHGQESERLLAMQALRGYLVELDQAAAGLAALDAERESAHEAEGRLKAAENAEPLRALSDQQVKLAADIERLARQLSDADIRVAQSGADHASARATAEEAERRRNDALPELVRRQGVLEEAKAWAAECESLGRETSAKGTALNNCTADVADRVAESDTVEAAVAQAKSEANQLLEKKRALSVEPEERRLIERVVKALDNLEAQEGLLRQAEVEHGARQQAAERQRQAVIGLAGASDRLGEEPAAADIRSFADEKLALAIAAAKAADATCREVTLLEQAAVVAASLTPGAPCPVCGACDHPSPAQLASGRLAESEAAWRASEVAVEKARSWHSRLQQALLAWDNAAAEAGKAALKVAERRKETEAATSALDQARGGYDRAGLRARYEQLAKQDETMFALDREYQVAKARQEEMDARLRDMLQQLQTARLSEAGLAQELAGLQRRYADLVGKLNAITEGNDLEELIASVEGELFSLSQDAERARRVEEEARKQMEAAANAAMALRTGVETNRQLLGEVESRLAEGLQRAGFVDVIAARQAMLDGPERARLRGEIDDHAKRHALLAAEVERLATLVAGRSCSEDELAALEESALRLTERLDKAKEEAIIAGQRLADLRRDHLRWTELEQERTGWEKRRDLADQLVKLLHGRKLVQFLAEEHLKDMAVEASQRLGRLTGQRYALELADECEFVIRDDFNGGLRRSVTTLSGGETFLTSLALALALSSKVQLRGQYPLGFFFLDEGFGTLDEQRLDLVMDALEKLHDRERIVGVISHVKEMKERLPFYLEVVPPGEDGSGSVIKMCRG